MDDGNNIGKTRRMLISYCIGAFLPERYASSEDIPPFLRERLFGLVLYTVSGCTGPGAGPPVSGRDLARIEMRTEEMSIEDVIGRGLATCPGLTEEEREEWITTLLDRTRRATAGSHHPDYPFRALAERLRGEPDRCYDPNDAVRYLVSRHGFRREFTLYAMLDDDGSLPESILANFEACLAAADVSDAEKILFLLNLPRFDQLRSEGLVGRAVDAFLAADTVDEEERLLGAALMCKEDELRSLLDKCHLLCSIEHIPEDALPVPRKEAMAKVLRYLRLFFREDGVPPDILRAYSERILGSHDTVFTFRTHHRRVARWMFEHAQVEEGTIGERMVTILEAEIERSRRKADIAHKLAALDFVHANPRSLSPGERERALEAGMRHSVGTVRELAFRYALLAADEREMPTLLARCGRDTNKAVTRTPVRILLAKDVPPEARARLLRFIDVRRLDLSPQQRSRVERMRREAEARRG